MHDQAALSLPVDLIRFLKKKKQLQYDAAACECGAVTLRPLEDLRLQTFTIVGSEIQCVWGDPHKGEGAYRVGAVDLIASCEGYGAEGILIWIPSESLFGYWDCDHHVIGVFQWSSWKKIVADPLRHLNAQWEEDFTTCRYLIPWPKYPWRRAR